MLELLASAVLMVIPAAQPPQALSPRWLVENVTWIDRLSASGRPVRIAEFSRARVENIVEHGGIIALEEQLLRARAANDRDIITRILSDDYYGTDVAGVRRTKAETVAQWMSSPASVTPITAQLRSNGNIIIVNGEQSQADSGRTARVLFTRVYVRTQYGWHLVSSTELEPGRQR
jgi:Domain of unknown function (DUF4440)